MKGPKGVAGVSSWVMLVFGLCLVLGIGAPAANAESSSSSFTWDGRCTEIAFGASVPVENVRALVPPEFAILGEESGTAILNSGIATCPTIDVDGMSQPSGFAGFTAVFIEPYEGAGPQRYLLWLATSSSSLHQRFRGLGLPSIHARDMNATVRRFAATLHAEGTVPRRGSAGGYALSLDTTDPAPVPLAFDAVYWHVGERGLARIQFAVSFHASSIGAAKLRAERDTVMFGLAGGERLSGGALLADFSFEGTIALVGNGREI